MTAPITQEEWARLRRDSTDAMSGLVDQVGLPNVLLPYQARTVSLLDSVRDCSALFVEKSRRIGLTWALAAYAVLRAARARSAGGMDVMYISYSREMTREFIDACAMWARAFNTAAMAVEECLFDQGDDDGDRSIQAFRIRFSSGFEILALSSAPRGLRGKQGVIIVDEAAFVDSLAELIKAAMAFLMWGGQVIVCSTHDGVDNPFNQTIQDIHAGRVPYKHLRIDFDQALQDGLYQRIALVKGETWTAEEEAEWRQKIIAFYGDGADEELFCIPSASSGAWLPGPLIEARMTADVRYLELAETVEERDHHYVGILGTRRRTVSQIEVTVEAASDAPADVAIADMIREWIGRDELSDEMFDILDCIGKGFSFTEIIWDVSEGQWQPVRLEYRDPRWFRFDRRDLSTPLRLDEAGQELPLETGKFIYSRIRAKSGVPLRSGLARLALWGWMFKAFTLRDWAIFVQTYGQPLRLGKWAAGASEDDKDTLFRAVANIAGDCGAIIPDSMSIEFVSSGTASSSADLYERRADWLDRQMSKAVLGQTATTDAIAGGHAVGREHRQVQEDIERSDAKAIAAILNRDLIQPWVQLEFGPQARYPRLRIERSKKEDIAGLSSALGQLVPLGLRVEQSVIRDRLGIPEPAAGAEILAAPHRDPSPEDQASPIKRFSGEFKRGQGADGPDMALHAQGPSAALTAPVSPAAVLADRLAEDADSEMARMLDQIDAMLAAAGSLEEFREMLLVGFPRLDAGGYAARIADGLIAAELAGRIAQRGENDDG